MQNFMLCRTVDPSMLFFLWEGISNPFSSKPTLVLVIASRTTGQ